ncbi:YdcF family protein [Actinomycetes bacterium M1A6_2h]
MRYSGPSVALLAALLIVFAPAAAADTALAPVEKYNSAQADLVTGKYEPGLAALSALTVAAPSDANIVALQAFYSSASGDTPVRDAALTRLDTMDPDLAVRVRGALDTISSAAESTIDYAPAFDGARTAIVVLGFGLLPDGSMRPELVDRLEAGLVGAQTSPTSPVVVTGGNRQNGVAEGEVMRDWLVQRGLDPARVHAETEANQTVQNALNSMTIVESLGATSVVLATSANHIRRAMSDFVIAGADVVGALSSGAAPEVPTLKPTSRLGLTVDATKVLGIPRTY